MAKILLIDDDPAFRRTLIRIVERQGHQPLGAADGAEGLRLFRKERPDIVVTDIVMPDKEGIETILELRREAPDARIIAISGAAAGGGYLEFARTLGADEVLEKPFAASELTRLIKLLMIRGPSRPADEAGPHER
jgi:DNA-binding response OmpR family regulator